MLIAVLITERPFSKGVPFEKKRSTDGFLGLGYTLFHA
jgi:hypothetical protein